MPRLKRKSCQSRQNSTRLMPERSCWPITSLKQSICLYICSQISKHSIIFKIELLRIIQHGESTRKIETDFYEEVAIFSYWIYLKCELRHSISKLRAHNLQDNMLITPKSTLNSDASVHLPKRITLARFYYQN